MRRTTSVCVGLVASLFITAGAWAITFGSADHGRHLYCPSVNVTVLVER